MHPYIRLCCLVASVAIRVTIGCCSLLWVWWYASISLRGKSAHTSPFKTKKYSGLPQRIWSLKWYKPPAVPNGANSCKYLHKYKEGKSISIGWKSFRSVNLTTVCWFCTAVAFLPQTGPFHLLHSNPKWWFLSNWEPVQLPQRGAGLLGIQLLQTVAWEYLTITDEI